MNINLIFLRACKETDIDGYSKISTRSLQKSNLIRCSLSEKEWVGYFQQTQLKTAFV